MESLTIPSNLPGWVALVIIILDRGIIPLVKHYAPIKAVESERAQDREDKKLQIEADTHQFAQDMKLREVEALEGIRGFMGITNERLMHIENDVKETKEDVRALKSRSRKTTK